LPASAVRASAQILDSLPDSVIIIDAGGIIHSANAAVQGLFGHAPDALLGQDIARLLPAAERDRHQSYVERYLNNGVPRMLGQGPREVMACRSDGSEFPVEISVSELRWDGSPCFVAVFRDITARRRAHEAVRISREFFQRVFDAAPVGIAVCDRAGRYIMVNPAMCEMVRYSAEELLTRNFIDITHPDDVAANVAGREPLLEGRERSFQMEKRYVRQDGQVIWALMVVSPITDAGGETIYTIGQMLDIDQLKRTERELVNSRRRLRALSAHQETLLEAERKHIAREVHDEMGQLLTALRMDVSLLRLRFADTPGLLDVAETMRGLVDRAIDVVRQVATNLRPAALDLGILPALEWLAEDFNRRWQIDCAIRVESEEIHLDDARTMAVFRVVQESLTNVARHAHARQVAISLSCDERSLRLEVRDDGKGFDVADAQTGGGFGLMGMRERILALSGKLLIASALEEGTRVMIEIPLDNVDHHPHPDR
jgi:PAS domain S-box-containing protein